MKLTPMMEQYFSIKAQHKDSILMFRLGDFYEMFFEDATVAARTLDIALTGRDYGGGERAPMCGVPAHAVEGYISRLVEAGHRVALCDQVEDARAARGLVKRDVTRVVTAGTITDTHVLKEGSHNYVAAIHIGKDACAVAAADITTGRFIAMSFDGSETAAMDELARINPAELIVPENFRLTRVAEAVAGCRATPAPAYTFAHANALKALTDHFCTMHLQGFGIEDTDPIIPAAGALLSYLADTQKGAMTQITGLRKIAVGKHMLLDAASRRNLELTETRDRAKKGSLLGVLDHTRTAMGARMLKGWVSQPLLGVSEIEKRLEAVDEWKLLHLERAELREYLYAIHDMERTMARLATPRATARDLATLRASLELLPAIHRLTQYAKAPANTEIHKTFDDLQDIYAKLDEWVTENPPATTREGGMVRPAAHAQLAELIHVKQNAQGIISEMETRERDTTGIFSLKIRVNKVFGYYIEVTAANLAKVPPHYIRKQTIANGERYITQELKELEEQLLGADEKIVELEYELFEALRREIIDQMARVQFVADMLAVLDCFQSLAHAAEKNGYSRPAVTNSGEIVIKEGRHPVVEALTNAPFVPNDAHFSETDRLLVITGPNMAGKSTYMRQVALIALMAQIGSFVPAEVAEIGVVDRVFTRVGASDDLATGQSTFMVEMTEVANILNNATRDSLILLDEIGRGTSTFDGLSIAHAVLEFIAAEGPKTLFATHYHELAELEGKIAGVANFCFTAEEQNDTIVFLRRLIRGAAGQSYGIHVARLAGLPGSVLARAEEVLTKLTGGRNA